MVLTIDLNKLGVIREAFLNNFLAGHWTIEWTTKNWDWLIGFSRKIHKYPRKDRSKKHNLNFMSLWLIFQKKN
jgi:hypothetical protein